MVLVADTSALVSLAIVADGQPIELLFDEYELKVPSAVVSELRDIASYEDTHADAAQRVLDRLSDSSVQDPAEQPDFPLDDGEAAAITLANKSNADVFLCDEYHELSTVHALLSESRLVTTPKLIEAFVLRGVLTPDDAHAILAEMVTERSWRNNTYVRRFLERFQE